jgi:hypothetical protein
MRKAEIVMVEERHRKPIIINDPNDQNYLNDRNDPNHLNDRNQPNEQTRISAT